MRRAEASEDDSVSFVKALAETGLPTPTAGEIDVSFPQNGGRVVLLVG